MWKDAHSSASGGGSWFWSKEFIFWGSTAHCCAINFRLSELAAIAQERMMFEIVAMLSLLLNLHYSESFGWLLGLCRTNLAVQIFACGEMPYY